MKHHYQPDQFTCMQGSAAILLSHFGFNKTPLDVISEAPPRPWPDKPDQIAGTPHQDIAIYFLKLGLDVEIISFDTLITDQNWIGKSSEFILERLLASRGKLTAQVIGRSGSELYIQAYIDFIKAGGALTVGQAPTVKLIEQLLKNGPIMTVVSYNTLYGVGKAISNDDRTWVDDDIMGSSPNHGIVIAKYENSIFTYLDPWKSSEEQQIESDIMIAAISAAQQECDNVVIVPRLKK